MTKTKTVIVTILCLLVFISCTDARKRKSRRIKRNHMTCRPRSLVRYQMTVHTTWDKETFPKMYPTYRPPAHWSQLIGRSHGDNYRMWQEGGNASLAVQKFAEKENHEFFDLELSQGYNGVLDAFVAPTIETSVGQTSTVVSLDGRHSKVSFMMKIVPSPDWFVGLDSTELCYRGRWRKSFSRDLRPFDAGTDQGLTFTSPRWPNVPRDPISAITSLSPDHPASSFFYPEYKVLPRLAYVDFEMISEYRLRKVHKKIVQIPPKNSSGMSALPSSQKIKEADVFKNIEDGDNSGKIASLLKNSNITSKAGTDSSNSNQSLHDTKRNSLFSLISTPDEKWPDSNVETREYKETTSLSKPHHHHAEPGMEMRSLSVSGGESSIRNPERTMESISPDRTKYGNNDDGGGNEGKQKDQSHSDVKDTRVEERTQSKPKGYDQREDCQVTEWSEWSSCSRTCGFGNKQRSREVVIYPAHGGSHCPLLKDESLCGSMRNCQWKHFSLMDRTRKRTSPFKPLRRRLVPRRRKQ